MKLNDLFIKININELLCAITKYNTLLKLIRLFLRIVVIINTAISVNIK